MWGGEERDHEGEDEREGGGGVLIVWCIGGMMEAFVGSRKGCVECLKSRWKEVEMEDKVGG